MNFYPDWKLLFPHVAVVIIGVVLMVCLMAAVPYGANLACVYVRSLDGRDTIYNEVGMPPAEWVNKHGGLSERTMIIGNLRIIPKLMNDINELKKKVKTLESWQKANTAIPDIVDPNEAVE